MITKDYTLKRRKGQHLTQIERGKIEAYKKEAKSNRYIAKVLGVSPQTINNEIKRGTVKQVKKVNGKTKYFFVYSAEYANNQYKKNRENSRKPLKLATTLDFIKYAERKILKEGYSPDVVCGRARLLGLFNSKTSICTKTLYNYINSCLIKVRNIDLKYKVVRKNKSSKINIPSKRVLGLSIEERSSQIDSRESFGHFEIDTVIGKKGKDNCILSITERKTRMQFMVLLDSKTADSVEYGLKSIFSKYGIDMFKSITSDNGLEFSTLSDVTKNICEVYFAHPYSAWERGSNENNNRMIRRYIPKGRCIDDYSREQIALIEDSINNLPRKILGYLSAKEAFEIELEKITKTKKFS